MNGIFIIDKPKGVTSRDVVNEIQKKFKTRKVGHTGTLDPLATGVLIVCVGSATKLVDILTSNDKEYEACATLGIQTDTLDNTGNVLNDIISLKSKDEIINTLNKFKGKYLQEVPKYSAIKINGKKLYEYARENIDVPLPKREVNIKDIELIEDIKYIDNHTIFTFKCTVSKGTYIRSLIRDIATSLETYGIMTDLRRIRQGRFSIDQSCKLSSIKDTDLINIEDIFDYKKIEIDESIKKKILNGAKVPNIYNEDKIIFTLNNEVIAIYEKEDNYLKPYKMLRGGNL